MKLEIIILSKLSQTEKDKYCIFSLNQNLDLKEKNNMTVKQGLLLGWETADENK
jgi:hypothetical protein